MEKVLGLKCRECGEKYPKEPLHVGEFCFGPLEVDYNYEVIQKSISKRSIERWSRKHVALCRSPAGRW